MKKNDVAIAALCLAVLIPFGSYGQQTPENLPPVRTQCQAEDQNFVKGQNLEIRCAFLIKENVTLNLDDLRQIDTDDFEVIQLSSTRPAPVPNEKDYNIVFTTQVLRPDLELKYGRYELVLELSYSFPEVKWKDADGKQILSTGVIRGVEKIPKIVFEKSPLIARIETGDGFQNVVNIGEHISYTLRVFYEKDAAVLLNDLAVVELEQKYGIQNATRLDNPDFGPFVLLNREDSDKKKETEREFHKELAYEYRLALYEVSLVKTFEIPPVNLYYSVPGGDSPVRLITQTARIRTNSVLNRDSEMRPLKGLIEPNPSRFLWRGVWPLRIAYAMAGLAGLIVLYTAAVFAMERIRKVRQVSIYTALVETKNRFIGWLDRRQFVANLKTHSALERLQKEPSQKNLKKFINQLRIYLGTTMKMGQNPALSYSTEEFRIRKMDERKVEILEFAESLLDENMVGNDLRKLQEMLNKLKTRR